MRWLDPILLIFASGCWVRCEGGLNCHQSAKQFGVGVAKAIAWVRRFRETGSVAPGQMGGHKPKAIAGEHRDWLLQRVKGKRTRPS